MIMKANKQIGFIYKDNESIDKILKDGDVVFERGFLREKTSTTLPITFGGVGKNLKDYKIYGNTVQKILPDEYTQVEYIKNTGLQYIDTGVYGNLNTEIRVKASNNGESAQLFGDITTQSRAISCNFGFAQAIGSRFGNKNISAILGNYITVDVPFELIENKNGMYIDNVEVIAFDTTDEFTTTNTLLLLNRNSSSGAIANRGFGNLYNCEIYDGNTLIRNFIPCYRNSDNEVGLYDLVNNVFYTNQGTGTFTYGSVAPTPDAPIEMVSCGDKSKNLYNPKDINTFTYSGIKLTRNTDDSYTINGTSTSSSSATRDFTLSNPITLKSGESVTFSKDNALNENLGGLAFRGNNETLYILNTNTLSYTYTATSDITIDTIRTFYTTNSVYNNYTFKLFIARGSNTTNEPYGYKIPVNVKSDNLFDKDNATKLNGTISVSYDRFEGGGLNYAVVIPCKSNTTYTVKKRNDGNTNRFALASSETIPSSTSSELTPLLNKIKDDGSSNLSLTTDSTANYLIVQYYRTAESVLTEQQILDSIMIVEGSTAPSKYIPYYNQTTNIYLDEPLRKKDGYSDYIDFINGKVVRNIKEYIFNGSNDDNYVFNSDNTNTLGINILPNKIDSPALKPMSYMGPPIICNKFDYLNDITDKEHIYSSNGQQIDETKRISNIRLYLNKSRLEGYSSSMTNTQKIELLKTWLSSNNITVDYILLSPTEESITLPNIPTIDGNNILNIETEITPSKVYIKYKSNN